MENVIEKNEKIDTFENGCKYYITLKVSMDMGFIDDVFFIIDNNEYRMSYIDKDEIYARFGLEIFLETKAIYHYCFTFRVNGYKQTYKNNNMNMSVNFETPKWTHGKIMYHIFTDRFNRIIVPKSMKNRTVHLNWDEDIITGPDESGRWNTDFFGGSLQGIIEKLDYIKSLGVSIIYLSPIFYSQSNHRYDTSDYEQIDPYLGDEEDLKRLCDISHEKGIKIVLDAVFNHTGNDSKYFNEYNTFDNIGAYQSETSPYYSFYKKNNDNFEYWWGMKNLPVCDGNSLSWQDYIYGEGGIIDKWFSYGIDGLRLDVADELTDEFIEGIRRAVKRNKEDGFILGEVWKNPMRMNRSYISSGKAMDSVMNYYFIDALIRYFKYKDLNRINSAVDELISEYPKDTLFSLMNFISTHDISRIINIFGSDRFKPNSEWAWNLYDEDYEKSKDFVLSDTEYNKGKEILKTYLYTLTFFPGILSIFYGDEIGMQGEGNLYNRRPFTWDKIDYELLSFFRKIGNIRKEETSLEEAELSMFDVNNKILMFERLSDEYSYLTFVSTSAESYELNVSDEYHKAYSLKEFDGKSLMPHGALTLKKRR